MVGAPVVHASHAGRFRCNSPWMPLVPYESYYLGETQIVDGSGEILARLKREDGDGVITAEITPGKIEPTEEIPDRFWIPDLPAVFKFTWTYQNAHGKRYYKKANSKGLFHTADVVGASEQGESL
jgi:hypothetical protein